MHSTLVLYFILYFRFIGEIKWYENVRQQKNTPNVHNRFNRKKTWLIYRLGRIRIYSNNE